MMLRQQLQITFLSTLLLMGSAQATDPMKTDNKHVQIWNKFARDCLKLHHDLTDNKNYRVTTRVGGYANAKNYYIEKQYFDKNRLVSRVLWEKQNPKKLHTIEVFVHDKKGRVIRDYTAAYLPSYENAPSQTLITFHHYQGNLHAFRTFDASGEMTLERCTGKNAKGQNISIMLDDNELLNDPDDIMSTSEYKTCFKGLKQETLGKYIIPQ